MNFDSSGIFGPGVDSIWKSKRKKRTGLTSGTILPTDIKNKLGEAEAYYISGNNNKAIEILSDVSREAPRLPDPYNIMALIYEESGDILRSLQLYVLSATFTPKNVEVWKKVYDLAMSINEYEQALMAINKCIKNSDDNEYLIHKIRLLFKLKKYRNIKDSLNIFYSKTSSFIEFIEFGDEAYALNQSNLAIFCYLQVVFYFLGTNFKSKYFRNMQIASSNGKPVEDILENISDLFYCIKQIVNIIIDRPVSIDEVHHPAYELLKICFEMTKVLQSNHLDDFEEKVQFPVDLALLLGLSKLKLGTDHEIDNGMEILNPILNSLESTDESKMNPNVPFLTIKDDIDQDIFLLEQRIRIYREFGNIGINTRAEKMLDRIMEMLLGNWYSKIISDPKFHVSFYLMWKSIGEIFFNMGKYDKSEKAFFQALEYSKEEIEVVHKYTDAVSRSNLEENQKAIKIFMVLKLHFMVLYESLVNYQKSTVKITESINSSNTIWSKVDESNLFNDLSIEKPVKKSTGSIKHANIMDQSRKFIKGSSNMNEQVLEFTESDVEEQRNEEENEDEDHIFIEDEADEDGDGQIDAIRGKPQEGHHFSCIPFNRNDIQLEALMLFLWAEKFYELGDKQGFFSLMLPLTQLWSNNGIYANFDIVAKRKNRSREKISYPELTQTITFTYRLLSSSIYSSLDEEHFWCFKIAGIIFEFISIERVFSKSSLYDVTSKVEQYLESIDKKKEAEELNHDAKIAYVKKVRHRKQSGRAEKHQIRLSDDLNDYFSDSSIDSELGGDSNTEYSEKVGGRNRPINIKNKKFLSAHNKVVIRSDSDLFTWFSKKVSNSLQLLSEKFLIQPESIDIANQIFEEVLANSSLHTISGVSDGMENLLPLTRLSFLKDKSFIVLVLLSYDKSFNRKHSEALEHLLDAFLIAPDQPIIALNIGTYLIMLSNHPLIKLRHDTLLKGLSFLYDYMIKRRISQTPRNEVNGIDCPTGYNGFNNLTSPAIEQEINYNLARALQEVQLNHLAADLYLKCLKLTEEYPFLLEKNGMNLTTESAHNLVIILKSSNSNSFAMEIMRKYLVF